MVPHCGPSKNEVSETQIHRTMRTVTQTVLDTNYCNIVDSKTPMNLRIRGRTEYSYSLLLFTARCYASAVLAMALCLSVCPSQVGVLLKRLNGGSHEQHRTIPQDSSFQTPKISAKFDRGHPLQERRMQVGWVKIGDFRRITGFISKTVQDRHILPLEVE